MLGDMRRRTRNDGLAGIAWSLCAAVERFPRPTIAAINGYALGGAASWRSRATSAWRPKPREIRAARAGPRDYPCRRGYTAPAPGCRTRLGETPDSDRRDLDAKQALAIGLVDTDAGRPAPTPSRELARKILRQGPLAARLAKLALNASSRVNLDSGLLIETLAQAICYDSDDKQEGTTAFLEKRKPKFTGR